MFNFSFRTSTIPNPPSKPHPNPNDCRRIAVNTFTNSFHYGFRHITSQSKPYGSSSDSWPSSTGKHCYSPHGEHCYTRSDNACSSHRSYYRSSSCPCPYTTGTYTCTPDDYTASRASAPCATTTAKPDPLARHASPAQFKNQPFGRWDCP